ncbi:alkaline phosphatase family protein [Aestuariibaculum sediminum]|uniref:Alkaline phosphatase n=1 Tax=Aestuariibaculum sediminum TaxID=2770637 RepID=A0A8J6Q951_9FLAO|nr:alkaline phosphatase [Aestuariibaculum sediminum]MBD0830601.1 alkaline phosphatase [Aestuariibaculum sediminum]
MKFSNITLFLIFISAFSCSVESNKTNRVIIIGIDGLSVEGFKQSHHPNLDSLLVNGTLSLNTRCVMPSVTSPNWTSHLTSGGPEQHGVTSNSWEIDNQNFPPIEQDSSGYYPSIFKVLKDQVPNIKTAYYYNWGNLINSINQTYLDDISFEENDAYNANYNKAFNFIKKHKSNPTLLFLYTVHVDHAGHQFGWMSPEYINAIETWDVGFGKLINNLKQEGLYDETNFIVISDHGGHPDSGHGGQSIDEMEVPWGITGPGIIKSKKLNEPNSNANTATVVSRIFNCNDTPKSWIGKVPDHIFE